MLTYGPHKCALICESADSEYIYHTFAFRRSFFEAIALSLHAHSSLSLLVRGGPPALFCPLSVRLIAHALRLAAVAILVFPARLFVRHTPRPWAPLPAPVSRGGTRTPPPAAGAGTKRARARAPLAWQRAASPRAPARARVRSSWRRAWPAPARARAPRRLGCCRSCSCSCACRSPQVRLCLRRFHRRRRRLRHNRRLRRRRRRSR